MARNNACSCNVSGRFRLKIKDIRLHEFDSNSCPSVTTRACKNSNCNADELNCSNWFRINKPLSNDAYNGYIALTGLSSLYSPSLIWIQILKKSEY